MENGCVGRVVGKFIAKTCFDLIFEVPYITLSNETLVQSVFMGLSSLHQTLNLPYSIIILPVANNIVKSLLHKAFVSEGTLLGRVKAYFFFFFFAVEEASLPMLKVKGFIR